ncbi:hypothetical protein [Mycobacterium sp.]|uniref:hypothetical protein n=1 Tax=Mycobacterium sp. TaxID=1785 RepID=UPI002BFA6C4B|nr:hypothetical protein [Mycobacterium sp.]HTQ19607.1 hypothetical protein [Mycobacterium sp.]
MSDAQRIVQSEVAALHADLNRLLLFARDLNNCAGVDYWIVQVPVGILHEVWRVQAEVAPAVRAASISTLAWLCRNALELDVWAKYISISMPNAKRFHQDAYVDSLEVYKLFDRVLRNLDVQWHSVIETMAAPLLPELERVLVRDKVDLSVEQLRGMKHLNVAQVAGEVGHGEVFALWNPVLSKLVHASAYNVLVAGKSMDGLGSFIVRELIWELRSAVTAVNVYLRANGLPQYGSL